MLRSMLATLLLLSGLAIHSVQGGVVLKYYEGRKCDGRKIITLDADCASTGNVLDLTCTKTKIFMGFCDANPANITDNLDISIPVGCFRLCDLFEEYGIPLDPGVNFFCSVNFVCEKASEITFAPLPESCSNPTGDCSFFPNCLHRAIACGPEDYTFSFGYPFCLQNSILSYFTSDKGKKWATDVNVCVQKALTPLLTDKSRAEKTCQDVKALGMNSNVECFVKPSEEVSICDLTAEDIVALLRFGNSYDNEYLRHIWNIVAKFTVDCVPTSLIQSRITFSTSSDTLAKDVAAMEAYTLQVLAKHGLLNSSMVTNEHYLVTEKVDGAFSFFGGSTKRSIDKLPDNLKFIDFFFNRHELKKRSLSERAEEGTFEKEYGVSVAAYDQSQATKLQQAIEEINTNMASTVTTVDIGSSRICVKECEKPNSSSLALPHLFALVLSFVAFFFL